MQTFKFYVSEEGARSKTFYLPRYMKLTWPAVRSVCKSYGMDIGTFDTLDELNAFISMGRNHVPKLGGSYHVGAVTLTPKSPNDWFWVTTGEKINYQLPWASGQPDTHRGVQYCLRIILPDYTFDDFDCDHVSGSIGFLCQDTKILL